MLETNKIYLGDCLNIMEKIDDNSIDLIVTDPPYRLISGGDSKNRNSPKSGKLIKNGKLFKHNNINFIDWLPQCYRILKDKTHIYVMCNDRNMQDLLNALEKSKFKLVNILIWKKNNCTPNKFYMKNCEFIVMARKGGERWINNKGTKQCLEINNIRNKKHPSQKPIELMEILITNSSNEGEIVLDMFSGYGTTCISAKSLNRKYIGIEKDEDFYNIIPL